MRTTLNIDDELVREAKIAAIREGITLTEYIERALKHRCSLQGGRPAKDGWTFTPLSDGEVPGFPWRGSLSEILEFVEAAESGEGTDADS
jgi:hypothetical protein